MFSYVIFAKMHHIDFTLCVSNILIKNGGVGVHADKRGIE